MTARQLSSEVDTSLDYYRCVTVQDSRVVRVASWGSVNGSLIRLASTQASDLTL